MDETSQQTGDKRQSRSAQARAPRAAEPCCGPSPLSAAVRALGEHSARPGLHPSVGETGRVPLSSEGREDAESAHRTAACVAASGDEHLPEDCRVSLTGRRQECPKRPHPAAVTRQACSRGPQVWAQPRCPRGGASGDEPPAPHTSEQFCNQEAKWESHAGMQLLTSEILHFVITRIRCFRNISGSKTVVGCHSCAR